MPAVGRCRRSAVSASLNRPITSVIHGRLSLLGIDCKEYLRLDASFSTEHGWTDKKIFDLVETELQQEEADLRGEVVHDDDDDDDPAAADDRHAEAKPSTSHAALASLDGLQDLLSKLNPCVFQSDLSAFEFLRHKISAFGHI
ncbi:hypothetical protein FRC12_016471 [Ceratobasidium sp. 428]|nr:hypothetical protein FRC12_016471 [Ceratobasidium sp. 428]